MLRTLPYRLLYDVFVVSSENSTVAELATTLQVELSQLQAASSFACRIVCRLEGLLYAVFVVSSENSTVAELATTLQVELSQLQAASSFACRIGSTMFKDFQRKLQQDTKKTVDAHVHASSMRHSSELKMKKFEGLVSTEVDDVSDITSYISFSFLDIAWLKFNTKLPVLIKSVLTREDAVKAMGGAYTMEHEAKVSKLKEHNQKLKRKLKSHSESYAMLLLQFKEASDQAKNPRIPIGDGYGDVNRFPDGDGDEAEKRG
ncbi:FAM91A1-like protein isoform X1 [Tanacetum coccineum]